MLPKNCLMTSKKTAAQKRTKAPRNSDRTKQFDKDWERLSASGCYDMRRLKEAASRLLAECGLSMSDGIRLFLRQVVTQRGLPFEVKAPNATTIAAMDEARTITQARFHTAQELFDDLEKDGSAKAN